jgi:hypothetical protein
VRRLILALLLLAPSARAEQKPAVTLTIDKCVDVDANDVRKIVEIELHTTIAEQGLTRVTARCRDNLIDLNVEDSITGKSLMRTVDVAAQAPKARARLLALAITELVSASWTELETNPTPAVPPAGPPPPPAAKAAARDVVHTRVPILAPSPGKPLRVLALIDRRAFLAKTAWVTGLGVRVAQDGAPIGWSAEMLASQGATAASLGEVAMDVVGVGIAATLSARWSIVSARGAIGLRGGAARLSGVPRGEDVEGASVRGPWGGPLVGGSISIVPIKPLVIEASVESGYVVAPVHARVDGERQVSVAGVWVAGSLAVGVSL